MTITFTIHAIVFVVLAAYLIVGMALWAPFVLWSRRFISPKRTGLDAFRKMRAKFVIIGILGNAVLWPVFLFDLIRCEYKYGIFKRKVN